MKTCITRLAAVCLLGVGSLASAQQPATTPADSIYFGGRIITMLDPSLDNSKPFTQAVAVRGGRIVGVGQMSDVAKFKGAETKTIDLGGKVMLPGFIDGHGHVFTTGIQAASANLLPAPDGEGNTIAKIQDLLREYAKTDASKKFNLILGFGYDDAQIAEKRHPTRQDLDEVSKDVPILIIHQSCHLGVMNTKALELAGIIKNEFLQQNAFSEHDFTCPLEKVLALSLRRLE
jgi:predicted amidohydrolase YtcJ